jgi:hypothetical protein
MEERALQVGDWVTHAEFGDGLILEVRGAGESASALVSFSDKSQRRLMLKFAKLGRREPPPGAARADAPAKAARAPRRTAGKQ